jgi:Na+-transporting methylmalonyl-CoA/oxaloacetate decarboxylase beta subunit
LENELFNKIVQEIGFLHLTSGHLIMWFVGSYLIYLGIKKTDHSFFLVIFE